MPRGQIGRRLLCQSALSTLARSAPGPWAQAAIVERPNILWLVSEDNSAEWLGCYGNPLARTPHIDALARDSIVYRNAHSTAPVCSPSRAALITGMYAHALGLHHHRAEYPLPSGVSYFPEYLRKAGYFTSNNGKTDYNCSRPASAAWDQNGLEAHWRGRSPRQPFFAVFNFGQSHESCVYRRRAPVTDPSQVRMPAYLPDEPEMRRDIARYNDGVAEADAAIGRVLRELESDGLSGETIIFYYGDNGGAVSGTKRFLGHVGTHIPLSIRVPSPFAGAVSGYRPGWSDELVSEVDFAPTVLSLAGLPIPSYMHGRALLGDRRAPPPVCIVAGRDRIDERYAFSRAIIDRRYL